MKKERRLPPEKEIRFRSILSETAKQSRLRECRNFTQHGDTTVLRHCLQVAYTAYYLADRFNIEVNEEELIRGALLHDYFMYDWHEKSWANSIHGFTHPRKALNEACKDLELSAREKNMILRHMFPLTPVPPKYREGVLLCVADKICAFRETIAGKKQKLHVR